MITSGLVSAGSITLRGVSGPIGNASHEKPALIFVFCSRSGHCDAAVGFEQVVGDYFHAAFKFQLQYA